jgi:DNA (cytosine-5)-methyltransferase 1
MTKLRVLDLFSGCGGFALGLERTGGFETAAFCEIEPFARRVLAKHWPGVPRLEDVANTNFEHIGPVDLVTAGFPCQDISFAGKGAGLAGERSGLFWHVIRAAGLVGRPKLLLENVAGLLDRGMGAVLGALASVGYDTEWHCIPASAVGAPHRRDRVWIVADPQRAGSQGLEPHYSFSVGKSEAFTINSDGSINGWCRLAERRAPLRNSDGLRPGVDRSRIKLCGNSVVPQIPELIGRAILQAEAAP